MFSRNKFFGKDGYPDQSITEIGIYTSWRSINYTSRYKVELKFDNGELMRTSGVGGSGQGLL